MYATIKVTNKDTNTVKNSLRVEPHKIANILTLVSNIYNIDKYDINIEFEKQTANKPTLNQTEIKLYHILRNGAQILVNSISVDDASIYYINRDDIINALLITYLKPSAGEIYRLLIDGEITDYVVIYYNGETTLKELVHSIDFDNDIVIR